MKLSEVDPIAWFSAWFHEPIAVQDRCVIGVLDALNRHPSFLDETAQDYFMPARRWRECEGRFRILGENQDCWYCFVYDHQACDPDPPVYFETCLDLVRDYGYDRAEILDPEHVQVASRFTDFLWHMLGHFIVLRNERPGFFADTVCGLLFDGDIELSASWVNPIDREFPSSYTCLVNDRSLCIEQWGAAFLDAETRDGFLRQSDVKIAAEWP